MTPDPIIHQFLSFLRNNERVQLTGGEITVPSHQTNKPVDPQHHKKGWRGNKAGHARAGQIGGERTRALHGEEFYSSIGKKGGRVSPGNFKNDRLRARLAGQRGGRRRVVESQE